MKKDIKELKLEQFATGENVDELLKATPLLYPWFLPQAQAHISEHWVPKRVDNYYCALATLQDLDAWNRGLYCILQKATRGLLVPQQTKDSGPQYCGLVPIILAAYKRYRDIPYSAWSPTTLKYIVDNRLCEAMLCTVPQLSVDELLELRELGLKYRTGKYAGQLRQPTSTWRLYNMKNTPIEHVPVLAQTMLTQIWCAHPTIRNNYMVLDPQSWDVMPAPLIVDDVFIPLQAKSKPTRVATLPQHLSWLEPEPITTKAKKSVHEVKTPWD